MRKQLIAGITYQDLQPFTPKANIDYPVSGLWEEAGEEKTCLGSQEIQTQHLLVVS